MSNPSKCALPQLQFNAGNSLILEQCYSLSGYPLRTDLLCPITSVEDQTGWKPRIFGCKRVGVMAAVASSRMNRLFTCNHTTRTDADKPGLNNFAQREPTRHAHHLVPFSNSPARQGYRLRAAGCIEFILYRGELPRLPASRASRSSDGCALDKLCHLQSNNMYAIVSSA